MQLAIVIVVIVVVITVAVVFVVRAVRSRSERSDWIGELSEIRRSSLGDDEEVTGAIEAVTVVEDRPGTLPGPASGASGPTGTGGRPAVSEVPAVVTEAASVVDAPEGDAPGTDGSGSEGSEVDASGTDGSDGDLAEAEAPDAAVARTERDEPPGDPSEAGDPDPAPDADPPGESRPGSDGPRPGEPVVCHPTRTVDDAGTTFHEYGTSDDARLRIEVTDPDRSRVVTTGDTEAAFAVDLPGGVLWFRSDTATEECSIRIPAGWVTATGAAAVLADEQDWSYVMCLGGTASIRSRNGGPAVRLTAGQIGRLRPGESNVDLVEVGVEALESEGLVRRQRRLDAAGQPDAAPRDPAPPREE